MGDSTHTVKHRNLSEALRAEILSGKYSVDRAFPSEAQISRKYGVSRTTIRKALGTLQSEGLIRSVQGRGTFVTKKGVSRKIGLIIPGVAVTDFFKPIIGEINRLAHESGYELHFGEVWSEDRQERNAQAMKLSEKFISGNFAGVIYEPLCGPVGDATNSEILDAFDKHGIPVVLLDCDIRRFPSRSRWDVVGVNDIEAGARIAEHLLSAGARRVHFLMGKIGPITFRNRLAGAELVLKSANIKMPRGGNVLYAEANDIKALKRYLKRQKFRPDAFICSNDAIAAVFKKTLESAGLRVPEDVMLTGFADLPIASLMTPTLTTVHQDREQMAQVAFRRLMVRIANPDLPPCDIFLPSWLVVRESTARVKGRFKSKKGR